VNLNMYTDYDIFWKTFGTVANFLAIGEPSLPFTAQTYSPHWLFLIKRIIWISIYLSIYTKPSRWLHHAHIPHIRRFRQAINQLLDRSSFHSNEIGKFRHLLETSVVSRGDLNGEPEVLRRTLETYTWDAF